jgi:ribosomal protein S18 acetylase RimI-like enzyme
LNNSLLTIRLYEPSDWPEVAPILRAIIQSGEYYTFDPATPDEEIEQIWIKTPKASGGETYVAIDNDSNTVLGTYFLKQNWPGLGAHIANAGYAVAQHAQGQGIASAMCEHSIARAKELLFRGMQFNFVVATNTRAVKLWQKHGFQILGTAPDAFHHQKQGYTDVHIMFRKL